MINRVVDLTLNQAAWAPGNSPIFRSLGPYHLWRRIVSQNVGRQICNLDKQQPFFMGVPHRCIFVLNDPRLRGLQNSGGVFLHDRETKMSPKKHHCKQARVRYI